MKPTLLPRRRIEHLAHRAFHILLFTLFSLTLSAQFSFLQAGLQGESLNNPTSLQFGPDGRLYVSQQNGMIYAYTIERTQNGDDPPIYTVTATESIGLIKFNTPNHNDDGTANSTTNRQVTGLLVTGTAQNPVLYVTSSDWRIAVGNDTGLDTNSGVISRLTWNGSSWDKVDIVRGLSRCEENHSINGLDLDEATNTLYVMVGGNANKGAPSNNFSGTPEYWTSAALLSVDLGQIESMTVYTDPRSGVQYVYDMPTLNDPSRTDITNSDNDFPYPMGHPMYNATIDIGDPFGGNNSANQAITEPGGPVQIFSGGYRNAYDVVFTQSGKLFTSDNGPNGGWGGVPLEYDSGDNLVGDLGSTLPVGNYITNEFNEDGSNGHGDVLYNIQGQGYYGGHPVPIRAFPSKAGVILYEEQSGSWVETDRYNFADLLAGVSGYFNTTLDINDYPDKPNEAPYRANILSDPGKIDIVNSSTNGITEYTYTGSFNGDMAGHILTASFNGNINRYEIAADGNSYVDKEALFSGFGNNPLDVTALGENDPFPGTIWVATHGSDNITVFEPEDFGNCPLDGDPALIDSDNDGYTDADEEDNGTNICSGGSTPPDNDGDGVSDLNDNDDDNDGILDVNDAFAIDASNGMNTTLPINYPFTNTDPGTGFFGLGFTGLMINNSTDYLDQYNEEELAFGGAAGKASVENVTEGDAYQADNSQDNAFQFGLNNGASPFTVHSELEPPFFDGVAPQDFQSFGIFIGTGDQDNYLKVVLRGNNGSNGIQVLKETGGSASQTNYNIANILDAGKIDLYLTCDPGNNTVQPYYSTDGGVTINALGNPVSIPGSWLDPNDNQALAIGIISTSTGAGPAFTAIWDFINVLEENMMATLVAQNAPLDFGQVVEGSGTVSQQLRVFNDGGPSAGSIEITGISFSGTDNAEFSYNGPSLSQSPIVVGPGNIADIPLSFNPGAIGQKSASAVITHSGDNSPLNVPLEAEVLQNKVVLYRVNAGGPLISAIDGDKDWEGENQTAQYLVAGGNNTNGFNVSNFHSSVDQSTTPTDIFLTERWDSPGGDEMLYSFPVGISGEYEVRLYMANGYGGTSEAGERVFDITIEGQLLIDGLDLSGTYGHQTGVMLSFNVNITDGDIEIEFLHDVENPLINGIEILGPGGSVTSPITIADIPDQSSQEGDNIQGPTVMPSGGSGANYNFQASGLPPNLDIEPTNGQIFGTIAAGAAANSPYTVTVTVSTDDPDDQPAQETFTWTVSEPIMAGDVLYRVNNGGAEISDTEMNWSADQSASNANGSASTGTPSPYLDLSYQGAVDKTFGPTNFTITNSTGAPDNIFAHERFSDAPNPNNMQWNFPVSDGDYVVTLLFAENWSGAASPGVRVFDVEIEGNVVLDDYDVYVAAGNSINVAVAETFNVTVSDGVLDIDFIKMDQNPAIKGIEVRAADTGPKPSATVSVLPGSGSINASTFGSGSFSISNTSTDGQQIESVTFGLSTNMIPEIVFDPQGQAGDLTSKMFTVDDNGNTGTITHSLSQGSDNDGYLQLDINFTDFGPGEAMTFSIDVDPTSIDGLSAPGPGDAGSVSGLELVGSTVSIDFDDNTTYTNTLYSDGSNGGSVSSLRNGISSAPSLAAVGLNAPTTVNSASQTLSISGGPANGTVSLLQVEGAFFEGGGDLGQMPFEINSAISVSRQTGIALDGNGEATVNVTLTDSDPEGGYNYFIATVEDGSDFGLASNTIVLEYDADATPPPASVLYRINVGGPELTAADNSSPVWSVDNSGSSSSYLVAGGNDFFNGNQSNAHSGSIIMTDPSLPPSVPQSLFNTERYDVATAPEMKWEFPIPQGAEVEVRLFFCELFSGITGTEQRVFDVSVEGNVPSAFDDIDQYAIAGAKGAFMRSHTLFVQDGTLDIEFIHGVENPALKGIEIISIEGSDNEAPVVNNPGDQSNTEGDAVSLQIEAVDDSDNLSYSATGLPPSLSIDPGTGLISGTIDAGSGGTGAFIEQNGIVVIEMESADNLPNNWETDGTYSTSISPNVDNPGNATGGDFIVWQGSQSLSNPGNGLITYQVQINNPGTYKFQWRNQVGNGTVTTEHNDTWLKIEADAFYGEQSGGSIVCPKGFDSASNDCMGNAPQGAGSDGWFKVYSSGATNWSWSTNTSDNDAHQIYARFDAAGTYNILVSARSSSHVIDRMVLAKSDYSGNPQDTGLPESSRAGGSGGAADNSPYNVAVTVTDDGVPMESSTVNFTWYVNPQGQSTATLNGTIDNTTCEGKDIDVGFYQAGSQVYSQTVQLGMNGAFSVANIPAGTYEVAVKMANSLQVVETMSLVSGGNTANFGELPMGDCDNNNIVDIVDFSILSSTFELMEGDAEYDARADFNCDGAISILDFSLLSASFETVGEEPSGN